LKRTGLKRTPLIRADIDARIKAKKNGLPPVAARWCGKVKGPKATATNRNVADVFNT